MGPRRVRWGRARAMTVLDKDYDPVRREGRTKPNFLAPHCLGQLAGTLCHRLSSEQTLLRLIKGSLYVIPFLVFYDPSSLYGSLVVGRGILFRVIVEFSLICWFGLVALRKKYLPSRSNLMLWAVCMLLLVTGLADVMGPSPYRSFWGTYDRMEGYLSFLHFGAFFLILTTVPEEKTWKVFWNLVLIASTMTVFYTLIVQYQGSRTGSNLGNADMLSTYLLLTGWIGLWLYCTAGSRMMRLLYGGTILVQFAALYMPAARGVVLALLCGALLFCLLYAVFGERRSYRRLAVVLMIALALLPILYFTVWESRFVQADHLLSRFSSLTDPSNRSRTSRFWLWAILSKGVQERPLLGWGQEQVGQVLIKYGETKSELFTRFTDQMGYPLFFDRAHNIVLDWLINAGILGLLSYLWLFGCACYLLWQLSKQNILRRSESITLSILLVSYFLQNLFYFDFLMSYIIFFAVLAYIGSKGLRAINSPEAEWRSHAHFADLEGLESRSGRAGIEAMQDGTASVDNSATGRGHGAFILVVSLVLNFILMTSMVNVRPYFQARALGETLNLFKMHNLDLVMTHFDQALSYNTFGDTEVRRWLVFLADKLASDPHQPQNVKERILQYAIRELEKEVNVNPSDLRSQNSLDVLKQDRRLLNAQQSAPDAGLRQ